MNSLKNPSIRFAANEIMLACRKDVAKAALFTTNFTAEAAQAGETLLIPLFDEGVAGEFRKAATTSGGVTTPSNNYGDADGKAVYIPMSFKNHPKKSFAFGEDDFNLVNGTQFWEKAGAAAGRAIGLKILQVISGKINKTNIPTSGVDQTTFVNEDGETVTTGSGASFSAANEYVVGTEPFELKDLAKFRAACKAANISIGNTILMLNAVKFSEVLAKLDAHVYGGNEAIRSGIIPSLFGYKAVIENDELNDTNLVGALVPADSIAIGSRTFKILNPSLYQELGQVTDDASGLVLNIRRGGDWRTGDSVLTAECLFGAKLIQPTKIVRLVTAATEESSSSSSSSSSAV